MNPNMSPVDWARRPIQKYADFTGRASRAEYWWYALALIIAYVVLSIVEGILGIKGMVFGYYGPLTCLLWLATIIPGIAVGIRRLHDTNRSGWWLLLPIIPYAVAIVLGGPAIMAGGMGAGLGLAALFLFIGFICAVALIVFLVLPGTAGENRYGPNPYGGDSGAAIAAE
ncbi:MAG TPA: DUF805 domain-containing protein [Sphingomicrobium sp.]|jgi:uncharacterized membrane protein YhaH (DUF805 family)|nr:DUF805 domain-containing protein [Sphingomicrobium sp.]